jgi:uncharacterized protein
MIPGIVLDTEVLVSGLGWPGPAATILEAATEGRLLLLTTAPLLAALRRVLAYPKLAKVVPNPEQLADLVADLSHVVVPRRVDATVDDESANHVLEAAVKWADFIVAGDAGLLNLRSLKGKPIVPVSCVDEDIAWSEDAMTEWMVRTWDAYGRPEHGRSLEPL